MERNHENYDRWKVVAMSVLRRKVEHDMEEEAGEEGGEEKEGNRPGSPEPGGKTSGLKPEDYDEQGELV